MEGWRGMKTKQLTKLRRNTGFHRIFKHRPLQLQCDYRVYSNPGPVFIPPELIQQVERAVQQQEGICTRRSDIGL